MDMIAGAEPVAQRRDADVFLSYSRQDGAFVGRLARAMEERGKTPWLDVTGIEDGEVFPQVLREAIERTQAMVFVVSPASAASSFCRQEVEHAVALGKRIVPVLHQPVPDADLPPGISERQWVQLGPRVTGKAVDRVVHALDADPEHTRQHTRVLLRAREWDAHARSAAFLARGSELDDAERWLTKGQGRDPAPTEVQAAWVAASRRSALRRQRSLLVVAGVVAVVAVLLLAVTLVSRGQALNARAAERSRALAAEADAQLARDPQVSILLAEEALRVKGTPEAMLAASRALDANTARSQLPGLGAQGCTQAMRMTSLARDHEIAVTTCDGWLVREDLVHRRVLGRVRVGKTASSVDRRGSTLAVGTDHGVALVDARTWTVSRTLPTGFPLNAVAFSPSGGQLAGVAADRVAVIDAGTGRTRVIGHTNGPYDDLLGATWSGPTSVLVSGFDVPPPSTTFVTGLVEFDVRTGRGTPVELPPATPSTIALRPNTADLGSSVESVVLSHGAMFVAGKLLASDGASVEHAEVWRLDARTHRVLWHVDGPDGQFATSVAVSPDGRRVAVGFGTGLAEVLDAATGDLLLRLPGHTTAVRSLLFGTGLAPVVTASQDGFVRTWAGEGTERVRTGAPDTTYGLVRDARGTGVLVFGAGPTLALHAQDGRLTKTRASLPAEAVQFTWSARGAKLAYVVPRDGQLSVAVYDGATGGRIGGPHPYTSGPIFGVSSRGDVLMSDATPDGRLRPRLLDPRTGHVRAFDRGPVMCLVTVTEFSPDTSRAVSYDNCGRVVVYDVASGHLLRSLQLPDRTTGDSLDWSPDGKRVYLAVAGGSLVVLDVSTGHVDERPGSQEIGKTVGLSPDGRFVAVGGSDGIVDVYDTRTLRLVRQHVLPRGVVSVVLTDTDLVVLDARRVLRVWDVCGSCEDAKALEREARQASVRPLTPGERAAFSA